MNPRIHNAFMILLTAPGVAFFVYICAQARNRELFPDSLPKEILLVPWLVLFSSVAAYFCYQKTTKSKWMEACKTINLIAGGVCAIPCIFIFIFYVDFYLHRPS